MRKRIFKKKLFHDKELSLWLNSFNVNIDAGALYSYLSYENGFDELYDSSRAILVSFIEYDLKILYNLFCRKYRQISKKKFVKFLFHYTHFNLHL